MVKLTTIRIVLDLVARDDLYLEHIDAKQHFSMVIWRKKFTWCSHKVLRSDARRKWCANFKRAYMALNKLLDNGIRSLIVSWGVVVF